MKNLYKIVLISLLLISMNVFAQKEYNPWSINLGIGAHAANDPSYVSNTSMHFDSHWDAGFRYNLNPTFALGLQYGRDNMVGKSTEFMLPENPLYKPVTNIDILYQRLSIETTVDILDVVDIHSNFFTLLAHGGAGMAWIDTSLDYKETMGLMSGGITGVFKLTNNIALKADYTISSHIDQSKTLDGMFFSNAQGMSSNVHSASAGIIFYIGKSNKKPADFYYKPDCTIIHKSDTIKIDNHYRTEVIENNTIVQEYTPKIQEFVFFDHDKFVIRSSEDNAIYQIYTYMKENDKAVVNIIGWASATSSSPEYNLELSNKRCQALKQKLLDAGINESRIKINPSGKDYHLNKENVHDLGRRVELLIK